MSKKIDYNELQTELDSILNELGQDGTDVDQAVKKYERGLVIIKELEAHLSDAENTVKELRARFDKS